MEGQGITGKSSMKRIIRLILVICAGLALFSLYSKKETNHEIISPIPDPTPTEQPIPTPTIPQEPEPTYLQGSASYYDRTYCEKYNPSCLTASGEVFDDTAFTCACGDTFSLGSKITVTYQGKSITVRCNDRGGFQEGHGRILDLSKKAFEALAPLSKGIIFVEAKEAG